MDDIKIAIPDPARGSELARIILDLEKLRSKKLMWEVPAYIFFQLKNIFQNLETLWSARIEGNNTTLAEYVEKIIEQKADVNDKQKEIENLETAIKFIEDNTNPDTPINRAYISELHKIITKDLTPPPNWEGSNHPWLLRPHNVSIKKSKLKTPDFAVLPDYFENFIDFINTEKKEQYQLLMVAIAHHRFAYIHPFDNGNGRMGRLLNYALLIKLWFKVKNGRIINPSSVFYSNRDAYYDNLAIADSLQDTDILHRSEYFLTWLKNEIEKIDSLLSKEYVRDTILMPALSFALERKLITDREHKILNYLISKDGMAMKSEELEKIGIENSVQKSRVVKKLRDKKMLMSIEEGWRVYTINFINNYLLRGIIKSLEDNWFISDFLNNNIH